MAIFDTNFGLLDDEIARYVRSSDLAAIGAMAQMTSRAGEELVIREGDDYGAT